MGSLQYVRMVLWSFFGIRRRARADAELGRAKPLPLLLAAIVLAGVFVTLLLGAAHWAAAATPVRVDGSMAQRVLACTACHGAADRTTRQGYFPRIAGKPEGYLFQQLRHFRDGRREHAAMAHLLAQMPDAYLADIAAHFAALEAPPPTPTPPGPDGVRGEALATRGDPLVGLPACVSCHGTALTGLAPAVPGLLGLPRDYLVAQIGAWKTGRRHATAPDCMATVAQRLSVEDIDAVSAWLASRPVPPGHAPAGRPDAGTPACGSTR